MNQCRICICFRGAWTSTLEKHKTSSNSRPPRVKKISASSQTTASSHTASTSRSRSRSSTSSDPSSPTRLVPGWVVYGTLHTTHVTHLTRNTLHTTVYTDGIINTCYIAQYTHVRPKTYLFVSCNSTDPGK